MTAVIVKFCFDNNLKRKYDEMDASCESSQVDTTDTTDTNDESKSNVEEPQTKRNKAETETETTDSVANEEMAEVSATV